MSYTKSALQGICIGLLLIFVGVGFDTVVVAIGKHVGLCVK